VEALRKVFVGDFSNPIVWIGMLLAVLLVCSARGWGRGR
jgi:hypothetical protein